ncbi:DUF721 domain-containing protein [Marinactinospora thermotolerans]|uniref:DUF721 domain-containing protein n=1 Tax=Marinactinospora thermotolerans TaxID=531310 RepID=UPI00190E5F9A|nr:DUF721 domain-containing protein [Marinactinospora thermotolerans]
MDGPGSEGSSRQPSGIELARQALAQARAAARERGAAPTAPRRVRRGPLRARREPQLFGDAIRSWLIEHGWQEQVAIGGVFGRWDQIVGAGLAEHVRPETFEEGELVVAADSPAWATQVRALTPQLLRRLNEELGQGSVRSIKVRGPGRPRGGGGRWRVR